MSQTASKTTGKPKQIQLKSPLSLFNAAQTRPSSLLIRNPPSWHPRPVGGATGPKPTPGPPPVTQSRRADSQPPQFAAPQPNHRPRIARHVPAPEPEMVASPSQHNAERETRPISPGRKSTSEIDPQWGDALASACRGQHNRESLCFHSWKTPLSLLILRKDTKMCAIT